MGLALSGAGHPSWMTTTRKRRIVVPRPPTPIPPEPVPNPGEPGPPPLPEPLPQPDPPRSPDWAASLLRLAELPRSMLEATLAGGIVRMRGQATRT
jgi:hypothetical protein